MKVVEVILVLRNKDPSTGSLRNLIVALGDTNFIELDHWANSVLESQFPSVCLYVRDVVKHPLPCVMETFG